MNIEANAAARKFTPPAISLNDPVRWLGLGWRDLVTNPFNSLFIGFAVFALSALIIVGLYYWRLDYLLLPALSAFLITGPLFAAGLYVKSKKLQKGEKATLKDVIFIAPQKIVQLGMIGVLLFVLALFWMRVAFLIYAVSFGTSPFSGLEETLRLVFTTPTGWALLAVGSVVGGFFAAFAFAVTVFSIPMLIDRDTDAMSAIGMSIATAWKNKAAMLLWGAIITALIGAGFITALAGLIIAYPLAAHASWRAYSTSFGDR